MSLLCKLLALLGAKEFRFRLSDGSGSVTRAGVGMFLTVGPLVIMSQRWFTSAKPLTVTNSVSARVKAPRTPKPVAANDAEPEFSELLQSQSSEDYYDGSDEDRIY